MSEWLQTIPPLFTSDPAELPYGTVLLAGLLQLCVGLFLFFRPIYALKNVLGYRCQILSPGEVIPSGNNEVLSADDVPFCTEVGLNIIFHVTRFACATVVGDAIIFIYTSRCQSMSAMQSTCFQRFVISGMMFGGYLLGLLPFAFVKYIAFPYCLTALYSVWAILRHYNEDDAKSFSFIEDFKSMFFLYDDF